MRDRRLWLLLAGALGIRLLLMPLPDPFDADLTTFWLPWMAYGAENGLVQLYVHGQPPVNYPPLFLLLLTTLGKLYGVLVPSFEYNPLQSVLIKLPAVLADLAVGILLYREAFSMAARRSPANPTRAENPSSYALLAAGLWLFNPAIIYVSAYWAQVDSIHTLWMLAALVAALAGRWGWSGLLTGLALLTKLHAMALLPLLLALAWRYSRRAIVLSVAALGGTLALGLLPFFFTSALDNVLAAYFGAVGFYPKLSVNAFNGWLFLQIVAAQVFEREILDTARLVGPITLRWVGLGLLGGYTLLLLWRLWGHLEPGWTGTPTSEARFGRVWLTSAARLLVFFSAGLLVFGFFSLATEMHERYGLPALAFLALPAARHRHVLVPYLLLTIVFSFNLLRVLPWGPGIFNLIQSIPGERLLLSLASVALFIWLSALYLRATRRDAAMKAEHR